MESTFKLLEKQLEGKKQKQLAHIHSYDNNKNLMLVVQDKIITETDHESSSCFQE